jgi:hypothetical protein
MSTPHTLSYTGKHSLQAPTLVQFGVKTKSTRNETQKKEAESLKGHKNPKTSNSEWVYKKAEWLSHNIYSRGPSVRFAFEEIGGFTLPRIFQQWTRNHSITGLFNTAAALEVSIREFASDFTNTLLPGLVAKRVARSIDQKYQTLLSKNLGSDSLEFYSELLKGGRGEFVNQSEFLERLEKRLNEASEKNHPDYEFQDLKLRKRIQNLVKNKHSDDVVQEEVKALATLLRLSNSSLKLRHNDQPYSVRLPKLVRDLRDLHLAPTVSKADPFRVEWGKQLYKTLEKTKQKMPHQLWGLLAAGVLSISTPFLIRLVTRHYYGEDAFPGTKGLTSALLQNQPAYSTSQTTSQSPDEDKKNKKFVLFPYLSQTLKQNDILPTLGTLGFFSFLGFMVNRRFKARGFSITKANHWAKVYEFDRHSPISTVAHLELLFGLLCGTRMASSRDDAEYRETSVRDCLLGWPTLTYGFVGFHNMFTRIANNRLEKELGHPTLLVNEMGVIRRGSSIVKHYFDNIGLGERTEEALEKTKRAHVKATMTSAGVNWLLLAILEPQLSIWLTNKLEMAKIQQLKDEQAQASKKIDTLSDNGSANPFR